MISVAVKRLMDVIVAALMLIILSPVLLIPGVWLSFSAWDGGLLHT